MPSKRLDPAGYAAAVSTNGSSWHGVRVEATPKPDVTLARKLDPLWWPQNSDQPEAPPWYRKDGKLRNLTWFFRNLGHNFTFYVIGVADKTTVRKGWYPTENSKPGGGADVQVTEYGYLRYPFFSYKNGWMYFYCGYRERGDWGIELHFGNWHPDKHRKHRPAPIYTSHSPPSQ